MFHQRGIDPRSINEKLQSQMERLLMLGKIEHFDNLGASEASTVAAKQERLQ